MISYVIWIQRYNGSAKLKQVMTKRSKDAFASPFGMLQALEDFIL